jgi:ABC-2 type transport system permease protein
MRTTISYTLRKLRGQILGWGIGIAALGLILIPFYDIFVAEQGQLLQMMESYPPEFLAFFGADAASMATPEGYLGMYGFSMLPVIGGIFAVIAGSGLLASDEESGRLDLILAYPVGRSGLFFGRLLAFVTASLAIMVLSWLGFALPLFGSSLDLTWGQMALPFFPLLVQILIYGSLALLFSMLLPARRLAATAAGLIMVASYFLTSMASLNEGLEIIAQLLPYHYFQGGDAINGLNVGNLIALMAAGGLFTLIAWWRFLRRDVRVAGEGSWGLPRLPFPRPAASRRA